MELSFHTLFILAILECYKYCGHGVYGCVSGLWSTTEMAIQFKTPEECRMLGITQRKEMHSSVKKP